MAHVYRLLAGVLGHFWRSQSGISVRNRSSGVDLLDRSILCRLSVFAGVVRTPIATQTCRTGVPELGYSPLPLLDGGEFISEVDCRDWDGFLWAVPKKRTSHSKKRMRMTHKYLKPTTLHAQNVKIWSYCTSCVVTAWKRLLEGLLLWGRKNKENTSNEDGLVLVYGTAFVYLESAVCKWALLYQ